MSTFGTPKKTLTFLIEDGVVTCEASGFVGPACEAATKEFTKALGGEVISSRHTPDFSKKTFVGQGQKAGA